MKLFRLAAVAILFASTTAAQAATFIFGRDANGITDTATASLFDDGITLDIGAGPAGALFDERGSQGLGVNSLGIAGIVGGDRDKLELLSGDPSIAGQPEFLVLSFDKPGVITAIDFDGVKDESLEYFTLTVGSAAPIAFFDSAANTSVPGAVDAAVSAGVVEGPVVFLREDGAFDDEIAGLEIPFAAGELLTITYAELGAAFSPLQPGNGARFEGLTATVLPEPATGLLAAMLAAASLRTQR